MNRCEIYHYSIYRKPCACQSSSRASLMIPTTKNATLAQENVQTNPNNMLLHCQAQPAPEYAVSVALSEVKFASKLLNVHSKHHLLTQISPAHT